ncbi:hypothetical protein [Thermaurantiacus sp.]
MPPELAASALGLLLGAGIALLVGLLADRLGRGLGLLDHPDPAGGRKLHDRPTPLVGGFGVVGAALAALLLPGVGTGFATQWFALIIFGIFLVGLADDRFGLTAPFRFLFAGGLLFLAIVRVDDFRILFLLFAGQDRLLLMPGALGVGFTLLCLLGLLNAVNMADGKNGLVIGQALIWTAILMVRLPPEQLPLLAAIAAALLVLLLFNMRGKLFLGDSGSYGVSAIFGLLAIKAWNSGFADMRAEDIALIFALPVFDTLRLIVQRLIAGNSPFTPGRDHLHHYLHARWGWPRPLPWILALVALPNLGALLLPGSGLFWLALTAIAYLALILLATVTAPARGLPRATR